MFHTVRRVNNHVYNTTTSNLSQYSLTIPQPPHSLINLTLDNSRGWFRHRTAHHPTVKWSTTMTGDFREGNVKPSESYLKFRS